VNWDALLWQIPALTIAAQAFLFVIAIGAGTSPLARVVALVLSICTLFLSALSMAKQRQSAIADATTLADFERRIGIPEDQIEYGPGWRDRRNNTKLGYRMWEWLRFPRYTAFAFWIWGYTLIALIDVVLITLLFIDPGFLDRSGWPWIHDGGIASDGSAGVENGEITSEGRASTRP